MKTYEYNLYNKTYKLKLKLDTYCNNNRIAVTADTADGEPFTMITVNIDDPMLNKLDLDTFNAVDTNNVPGVLEFIEKYELGVPVGIVQSGYCSYPIVKFNLEKFK